MKKMTNLLSLFLILIIVVGLFTACKSKEENKEETFKKVINEEIKEEVKEEIVEDLVADISVQVEEAWLPYYQEAANRVLDINPNSTISFITIDSFEHLDILDSTDVTNDDIADVFALPITRIYGLAQKEALAEIDALTMAANIGGFGDYDAGFGGNLKVDNYYLAFPMNIETLITFANTANAKANGIDLTTTIEFTDLKYQDILVPVCNAWFGVVFTNAAGIALLAYDESGKLYSDMTKEFADLTPAQQDIFTALFNYWKEQDKASTNVWDKEVTWDYMDTEFTTGGMNSVRIEGPQSTEELSEKAGNGEDLEILPITQVTVAGNLLNQWQNGCGLAINVRVEGEEEKMLLAQAMIEEIVNPEFAIEFFIATGKILENVAASVYEASDISEIDKKVVSAVIKSYQFASPRPLFSEWNQVWGTWEKAMLSWATIKPATVEEAYKEVNLAFDVMMSNF